MKIINRTAEIVRMLRAQAMRKIFPANKYWLAPISSKFGYDRGTPIDRYWIEKFLQKNEPYIKGKCLEITDNTYTNRFSNNKVKSSDVLDIDSNNKKANIHGDLRDLKKVIKSNTYDCILLTHVLGLIDEVNAAVLECHRILKPGGILLATSACLSPTYDTKSNYWRFTPNGARYLFNKAFGEKNVEIESYGNVKTGQCFWVGMSQEDLTQKELEYNDPKFPCIVAIKAVKNGKK